MPLGKMVAVLVNESCPHLDSALPAVTVRQYASRTSVSAFEE